MGKRKKFTKTAVRRTLNEVGAHLPSMAEKLDVTPRTIRNYLDAYDLWDEFETSQKLMRMIAASNITHAMEGGDVDISKWVLERLGKHEGWAAPTKTTDVQIQHLGLSEEARRIAADLGWDVTAIAERLNEHLLRYRMQQADVRLPAPSNED